MGSGEPYGYFFKHGEYCIKTEEAVHVQKMFELYKGMLTSKESQNPHHAMTSTVKKITYGKQAVFEVSLRNPIYIGYLSWDSTLREKNHEADNPIESTFYRSPID